MTDESTPLPIELEKLLEACEAVARLQHAFDVYQMACFSARPPEFFALELNGEAGELANLEKKAWKGRAVDAARFSDEAADVCIALMNYCNARGIDLSRAMADKLREIERRRRHELAERE